MSLKLFATISIDFGGGRRKGVQRVCFLNGIGPRCTAPDFLTEYSPWHRLPGTPSPVWGQRTPGEPASLQLHLTRPWSSLCLPRSILWESVLLLKALKPRPTSLSCVKIFHNKHNTCGPCSLHADSAICSRCLLPSVTTSGRNLLLHTSMSVTASVSSFVRHREKQLWCVCRKCSLSEFLFKKL